MSRHHVVLKDASTGEYVDAELIERVDAQTAKRAEDAWLTYIAATRAALAAEGKELPKLPHEHWEWAEKVRLTERLLPFQTMGIEREGNVEGLIFLRTDRHFSRITPDSKAPLVYVDLLAAAPWNLTAVTATPKFRGVGTTLLSASIQLSIELEFKGRIGLHALPTSEPFYERHQMTCLGPDGNKQGMKYYECTPEQAAQLSSQEE